MIVNLHGIFAQDYGPQHRIEANTVAEAIEGLTRQLGFYGDRQIDQRPTMRVVGIDDPLQLYEKTEQKEIHLVPAMMGGGGFAKIIVGVAIIAFALTNPFGWAWLTTSVAVSLAISGATIALSGVMQLFQKAPKIDKGTKDPEASQYLGIGDNTVAIGTPIPWQCGRGPATGHLLAVNVDSSDFVVGNFPTPA